MVTDEDATAVYPGGDGRGAGATDSRRRTVGEMLDDVATVIEASRGSTTRTTETDESPVGRRRRRRDAARHDRVTLWWTSLRGETSSHPQILYSEI